MEFKGWQKEKTRTKCRNKKTRKEGSRSTLNFSICSFGETEKAPMKENKNIPAKGENIETEINVKLEDAYYGAEKKDLIKNSKGQMKTFSVKVPAGIRNGEKIRLLGQGKEGINGGKNGDLFIKINIENNKKFTLKGCDIITSVAVSPWEAALGKKN